MNIEMIPPDHFHVDPVLTYWARWQFEMSQKPALRALINILNVQDQLAHGVQPERVVRVEDREPRDADRLRAIGKQTFGRLIPDLEAEALEEAAVVCAEGADGEYAGFDGLQTTLKTTYRRWGTTVVNAYLFRLEGR